MSFTNTYMILGYELEKTAGFFDSENVLKAKRKDQTNELNEQQKKFKETGDIDSDWNAEKALAAILGIGGAGAGAAYLNGVSIQDMLPALAGGGIGALTGYGLSKAVNAGFNNSDKKHQDNAFTIARSGINNAPGWMV